MVDKLTLKDESRFIVLGSLIHRQFSNLYSLQAILNNPFHYLYGYYRNGKLVGFVHFVQSFEVFDLVNLVVDKKWRKKGIASSLLDYAFANIKDMRSVLLEVRESNKEAVSLYTKYGFQKIHIRKRYYGNEDALIMEKVF